jgi:hypothetical protein
VLGTSIAGLARSLLGFTFYWTDSLLGVATGIVCALLVGTTLTLFKSLSGNILTNSEFIASLTIILGMMAGAGFGVTAAVTLPAFRPIPVNVSAGLYVAAAFILLFSSLTLLTTVLRKEPLKEAKERAVVLMVTGAAFGSIFGIVLSLAFGIASGVLAGTVGSISIGAAFAVAFGMVGRVARIDYGGGAELEDQFPGGAGGRGRLPVGLLGDALSAGLVSDGRHDFYGLLLRRALATAFDSARVAVVSGGVE